MAGSTELESGASPPGQRRDPMPIAVIALGLTQIMTWGTTFYVLGVLGTPIGAELRWSAGVVYSGFAIALLVGSLTSTFTGSLLDIYGGRVIMSVGSISITLGLLALSMISDIIGYLAAWAYIGLAMRLTLYDAAFAALVQVAPSRGRRAISYLTLFGGFASTIFWPIAHYLNERVGWRDTLVVFAFVNLLICLPLHWWGISKIPEGPEHRSTQEADRQRALEGQPLQGRPRTMAIVLFAFVMSLTAFVFGVSSLQLVVLLGQLGLSAAAAVWIASLKGVAQVAGRIAEIRWGQHLRAMTVARVALGGLFFSMIILVVSGGSVTMIVLFTLIMGASQGVVTIVRGAVPLALFGVDGYGRILGIISTPIMVVNALSPAAYAVLSDTVGPHRAIYGLLLAALLAMLAMEAMSLWHGRQRGD